MDPASTISKIFMLREQWIPDHKAPTCYTCKSEFGFFTRRHHCRMCGNIFDSQCADRFVEPPLFIYETEKKIRLCKSCFTIISRDMRNDRLTNCKGTALNFYLTPAQTHELERCVNLILGEKWMDLSKKVLTYMLNQNGLYDAWFTVLESIVDESVETVQPSTLANDDIDISQYIKVKTIPYKDNSLTRLVRGVAIRKNFTSRKMNNEYSDASVLMLRGSVEKAQIETQVLESDAITAECVYLDNIVNKILELNPSVIIIEGNIGRTFQEGLIKAGKALVIRLRHSQFEKIQRSTNAKPIQELDKLLTADSSVLGSCMNLYVQNYQNKELYEEVKKFRPDDIYGTFDPSLMFIESLYPEKGATILLSGPKFQELQLVKKCLQETFRILRNLFLEKAIISQEIFMFHTKERLWELMANDQPCIRLNEDNATIREKLALESYQNTEIEEISLTSCLLNQNTAASVGYMLSYLVERAPIDQIIRVSSVDFTKFVLAPIKFISFPDLLCLNAQQIAKIEEEVKHSTCWYRDEFSQMEKYPQLLKVYFYNKEDLSLGNYLWNKYVSVCQTCSHCSMDLYSHVTVLLIKNFFIKITMEFKDPAKSSKLQKIKKKNKSAQNKPNQEISDSTSASLLDGPAVTNSIEKNELMVESPQPMNASSSMLITSTAMRGVKTGLNNLTKSFVAPAVTTTTKTEVMMFIECSECGNRLSDKTKLSSAYLEYSFTRYLEGLTETAEKYIDYLVSEQVKQELLKDIEHTYDRMSRLKNIPRRPNVRPCCPFSSKNRVFMIKDLLIRFTIGSSNPYSLTLINYYDKRALIARKAGEKELIEAKKTQLYQLQKNYLSLIINSFKVTFCFLIEESGLPIKLENIESATSMIEELGSSQKDAYHILIVDLIPDYKAVLQIQQQIEKEPCKEIEDPLQAHAMQMEFFGKIAALAVNVEKTRENYLKLIHAEREKRNKDKKGRQTTTMSYIGGGAEYSTKGTMIGEDFTSTMTKLSCLDDTQSITKVQEYDKEIDYVDNLIAGAKVDFPDHPGSSYVKLKFLPFYEDQPLSVIAQALNSPHYMRHIYVQKEFDKFECYLKPGVEERDPLFEEFLGNRIKSSPFTITEQFNFKISPVETEARYLNHLVVSFPNKRGAPLLPFRKKRGVVNLDIIEDIAGVIDIKQRTLGEGVFCEKVVTGKYNVIVYCPTQFEALRFNNNISLEDYLNSLSCSNDWNDNAGGKTGAKFIKTYDQRYVFKQLDKKEFSMLLGFVNEYMKFMWDISKEKRPSILSKIYGMYEIQSDKKATIYIIAMENLFFGTSSDLKIYDLKGSKLNRYCGKKSTTMLDTDFVVNQNGEPIVLKQDCYEYFDKAVKSDTEFLQSLRVVDYSLLLLIDENNRVLRMGIIDYLRLYDLEKQLEHMGKKIIRGSTPTITTPDSYKERFQLAMKNYFVMAPCI